MTSINPPAVLGALNKNDSPQASKSLLQEPLEYRGALDQYNAFDVTPVIGPRVAWLFKIFGHEGVHILNNFRLWVKLGLPVETGEITGPESTIYPTPSRDDSRVILFEELRDLVLNGHVPHSVQIVDSQSAKFWTKGPPAESTPVTGHIPHSIHLPLSEILDPNNKTILPSPQLRKIFQAKGIKRERTLVTTCGAGITAAVVEVAFEEAGYGTKMSRRLFDGSWREWSQRARGADGLIV